MDPSSSRPGLLDRLSALLSREPEDRAELMALLHSAFERHLLDADALAIIEGALQVSEMQVRDVMVPRARMDVIHIDEPPERVAAFVIETAHSRFPAVGADKDDVLGILLAKDLLRRYVGRESDLRQMLRPVVFVPESKRLNVLLREFRVSRNHMAVVVDEYGGVSGLITIEDVLEQIVGDIEDEYDLDDSGADIRLARDGRYRVKATTPIDAFNHAFETGFDTREVETIAGFITQQLGHVPKRGEVVDLPGLRILVSRADGRRVQTLLVERRVHVESPS
ncbi:MAG: CBS domain-containing protein [Zoogloeaceae bacterium]|nr:CBS domain-containing protein [Zoogloeaceae bacterium]